MELGEMTIFLGGEGGEELGFKLPREPHSQPDKSFFKSLSLERFVTQRKLIVSIKCKERIQGPTRAMRVYNLWYNDAN
jgi:hypothetical protein